MPEKTAEAIALDKLHGTAGIDASSSGDGSESGGVGVGV